MKYFIRLEDSYKSKEEALYYLYRVQVRAPRSFMGAYVSHETVRETTIRFKRWVPGWVRNLLTRKEVKIGTN